MFDFPTVFVVWGHWCIHFIHVCFHFSRQRSSGRLNFFGSDKYVWEIASSIWKITLRRHFLSKGSFYKLRQAATPKHSLHRYLKCLEKHLIWGFWLEQWVEQSREEGLSEFDWHWCEISDVSVDFVSQTPVNCKLKLVTVTSSSLFMWCLYRATKNRFLLLLFCVLLMVLFC